MKGNMRGWLIGMAILLLLLSACSKDEKVGAEEKNPEPTENDEVEEVVEETEDEDEVNGSLRFQSPFIGALTEDENWARPVLATINNHPAARPQSGISQADVVYEFLAEGNMTRFLALFQSELPETVGPIRSARDYFVYLSKGMDAFYVAHGYSPDAKALLDRKYVDHINGMQYDGTLFKRSSDRKAPHNSYISGENIKAAMEKTNSSTEIVKVPEFAFHDSVEDARVGDIATMIDIRFSSDKNFISTFSYDPENATYDRMVNGIKTIDKLNDTPVGVSNILVLEAGHRTIDSVGRLAVDIESGGKAILFQAGIAKELEWKNIDGFLVPVENGELAKLVPGRTWVHIVPTSGISKSVTYTP
ncbi:DUF3048 domain-containing protein [Sporosarcina thermotolerans]|uniref:DUF3048 domain-containing protein n=1 Tax=Sporosarcina thermotolerans TaxID=633404 RepID=A0AAW9AA46_9BACL|nr:DUF3048 domain-containing protein [Sporosarcina thermotolerans]MDW0117914.1 DUF3048 domain-containing protein [Sporosarcina thermotolerans]